MKLLPREIEKLGLHQAGFLAQKRLARGLRLNYTEAVALIASQVLFYGDYAYDSGDSLSSFGVDQSILCLVVSCCCCLMF